MWFGFTLFGLVYFGGFQEDIYKPKESTDVAYTEATSLDKETDAKD